VSEIEWAHAVNSMSLLKSAMDEHVHFVEVDIRLRTGTANSDALVVVTSHDPTPNGDEFEEWFTEVITKTNHSKRPLGIKCDFKDIEAVLPSIKIMEHASNQVGSIAGCRMWLNADVLQGPRGAPVSIDTDRFLTTVTKHAGVCVLSLGWTTSVPKLSRDCMRAECTRSCGLFSWFGLGGSATPAPPSDNHSTAIDVVDEKHNDDASAPAASGEDDHMLNEEFEEDHEYTEKMIDDMLALCDKYRLQQVTFAVRACYVPKSWSQLVRLLEHNPNYSLTIFGNRWENNNRDFIFANLPLNRVFLDFPGAQDDNSLNAVTSV
jgi:Menorin